MTYTIEMPQHACEIIRRLQERIFKAYAVGGCVRDSILKRTPNDWDICTSALPQEIIEVFSDKRVIETGLKHGTVTVLCEGEPYEVTTFRIDGTYTDNRRPDFVSFTADVSEDLKRRDFTINAMAYNDNEGLVDLYGGTEDIKNKIIRCVGDAKKRFEEDALRILRAVRFACQLDFEIEESTSSNIHLGKERLSNVSAERIRQELCKMVVCPAFPKYLREYIDVFGVFMPSLLDMKGFEQNNPHHIYDVLEHTLRALEYCPSHELAVRLSVLLHDIGKPCTYSEDEKGIGHFYGHADKSYEKASEILAFLKFDNETKNDVLTLVKHHDAPIESTPKSVKKWLGRLGERLFFMLLDVKESDNRALSPTYIPERLEKLKALRDIATQVIKQGECFSLKDLAVSGRDLIAVGFKADKSLGEALGYLLDCVISEKVQNEREALLLVARQRLQM